MDYRGTMTIDDTKSNREFFRHIEAIAAAQWPAQLEWIKLQSLASGKEVVYDLSMFDLDWSPIFFHTSDEPIAWINRATGERRDGNSYPN